MRTRRLVAVLAIALFGVVGWATVASAQEGGGGGEPQFVDDAAEECHKLLEEGSDIDDCHEAPNPILPETNEIVWGGLSFMILSVALWKLAWPQLSQAMNARAERIRSSLQEAEQAKSEAQRLLEDYQRQLDEARSEAGRVIEEARQTADALRRDLQQRAEQDVADMRQRAAEEINAAKDRAMAELRDQITELAIGAAERVVERNLDPDTNRALVDQFIERVGAR
jgi:F-type H+-transporting ATPase subunit b